jgi:hypothetical protein
MVVQSDVVVCSDTSVFPKAGARCAPDLVIEILSRLTAKKEWNSSSDEICHRYCGQTSLRTLYVSERITLLYLEDIRRNLDLISEFTKGFNFDARARKIPLGTSSFPLAFDGRHAK